MVQWQRSAIFCWLIHLLYEFIHYFFYGLTNVVDVGEKQNTNDIRRDRIHVYKLNVNVFHINLIFKFDSNMLFYLNKTSLLYSHMYSCIHIELKHFTAIE